MIKKPTNSNYAQSILFHAGEKELGTDIVNVTSAHDIRRAGARRLVPRAVAGLALTAVSIAGPVMAKNAAEQQADQYNQQGGVVDAQISERDMQREVQNAVNENPGVTEQELDARVQQVEQ